MRSVEYHRTCFDIFIETTISHVLKGARPTSEAIKKVLVQAMIMVDVLRQEYSKASKKYISMGKYYVIFVPRYPTYLPIWASVFY